MIDYNEFEMGIFRRDVAISGVQHVGNVIQQTPMSFSRPFGHGQSTILALSLA